MHNFKSVSLVSEIQRLLRENGPNFTARNKCCDKIPLVITFELFMIDS